MKYTSTWVEILLFISLELGISFSFLRVVHLLKRTPVKRILCLFWLSPIDEHLEFTVLMTPLHARILKVLPEGVQLWHLFFLIDEGRKAPNTTLSGLLLACQQNPLKKSFYWQAMDDSTWNSGLIAL